MESVCIHQHFQQPYCSVLSQVCGAATGKEVGALFPVPNFPKIAMIISISVRKKENIKNNLRIVSRSGRIPPLVGNGRLSAGKESAFAIMIVMLLGEFSLYFLRVGDFRCILPGKHLRRGDSFRCGKPDPAVPFAEKSNRLGRRMFRAGERPSGVFDAALYPEWFCPSQTFPLIPDNPQP